MREETIVVGFDGSEQAKIALNFAKDLAQRYQAEIHLLHVIDWSPYEFHTWEENEDQAKSRKEQVYRDRQQLFPPLIEELKAAGINADAEIRFGHPAEVVTKTAEVKKAKLIVVGRRGLSKLKRVVFGSVASDIVHHAPCPVVVVP